MYYQGHRKGVDLYTCVSGGFIDDDPGNGLAPSGHKPLSEALLTKTYDALQRQSQVAEHRYKRSYSSFVPAMSVPPLRHQAIN